MNTETQGMDLDLINAREAAYGFAASALTYPEVQLLDFMKDSSGHVAMRQLLQPPLPALFTCFERIQRGFKSPADDQTDQLAKLQNTYTELFGHAVRGTCPPYELEYGNREILQQASELADIAGFYQAFGMKMVSESHERPDHIAVECEFMSVLTAKQAYAIETSNHDAQRIVVDAQQSFLADHLCKWCPAFAHRTEQADPEGFYGMVAQFLGEVIRGEADRFGIACGPSLLELRPVDEKLDREIQCGVEESCPGGGSATTTGGHETFVPLHIDRA